MKVPKPAFFIYTFNQLFCLNQLMRQAYLDSRSGFALAWSAFSYKHHKHLSRNAFKSR